MDFNTLISIGVASGLATVGWFVREIWNRQEQQTRDLTAFKEKVLSDYVPYDRLKDALQPIMDALKSIQDDLKTKAEKQ
jgi:hypothetical protein